MCMEGGGAFFACTGCYVVQRCHYKEPIHSCISIAAGTGSTCNDVCGFLPDSNLMASYINTHTVKIWSGKVSVCAVIPLSSFTVLSSSCIFLNSIVNLRLLSHGESFAGSVKPNTEMLFIRAKINDFLFC